MDRGEQLEVDLGVIRGLTDTRPILLPWPKATVRIEGHHSYRLEHARCYHRKGVQSAVNLFFGVGFNQ
jgi:hypothetical protein